MTTFENRLARLRLEWVWTGEAYTTVHNNFGFIVYYKNEKLWLCVLAPKETQWQLDVHKTKPPYLSGNWNYRNGYRTERMFELPVSNDFLAHVIGTAHPEMFKMASEDD